MPGEIINRVANSKLITLDLEDYYPEGDRIRLDIETWLYQGIILKEKDFRAFVDSHDWQQYRGKYVAVMCSSDAIIPGNRNASGSCPGRNGNGWNFLRCAIS